MELTAYHPFKSADAKAEYLQMYDHKAESWPVPSEMLLVETSYGQTFVRISGPANGEPLVLLHGAGSDSLSWIPNAKALSGSFRIYAVDIIGGCGRSIYTRDLPCIADYLSWMDELFTGLRLGDRINLMGLSYGGMLATQYALLHPERLGKIVLLAPAATVQPLSKEFAVRALFCALPIRSTVALFSFWVFEDFLGKDPANRKTLEVYMGEKLQARRCFKAARLVSSPVLTDEELRSISVPTLFLVGEHEKIYPARSAIERLNRIAPQVQTRVIPNAGHDLNWVHPDLISQLALDFLREP